MSSPVAEAYLETIYNMTMEEGSVRAVDLAGKFGVSRPTVAENVRRLVSDGLVTQDRSSGINLTTEGRQETEELLRRHRLAERLLFDVLGMDFISAHEQAHALEHWISPEVEAKISSLLGAPVTCPHGNPIPGNAPGGIDYLRARNAFRLATATGGDVVNVVSISEVVEDESALLRQLMNTGIVPGNRLRVLKVDGETVHYEAGDKEHTIDRDLAHKIWVSRTAGTDSPGTGSAP